MQDTEYPYPIAGRIVDQDVIPMRDQLAGTSDTTASAQAGILDQAGGLL